MRTNDPIATIVPLAFVVALGMLKELLADLKRWREDRRTNQREYEVVGLKNVRVLKRSEELRVGDIIELDNYQTVPADCLLLATEDASG